MVASLRAYTSVLTTRNEALMRLSHTSMEIRSRLKSDDSPDISDVLERRAQDCARFDAACQGAADIETIVDTAIESAQGANDELGELARSVITLQEDSRTLAQDVLACQIECEALLKKRIEATARAIRESSARRKLDAAYGPACKHNHIPMFMDKQQ